MTLSPTLPQAAIDLVVAVLVRLLLPALAGDTDAAKSLAVAMLAEYQPRTIRELGIAGEIISLGLDSLNALAEAAQPGLPAERVVVCRRWACSLSRTGHQAQRRLDALQRARQRGTDTDGVAPPQAMLPITVSDPAPREAAAPPAVAAQSIAAQSQAAPTGPAQTAPAQTLPAQTTKPPVEPVTSHAESALSQAECGYVDALTQLNLMKARYKGAPPPHSQAAQQIQSQRRIVDTARMKLDLLRKKSQPVRAAA